MSWRAWVLLPLVAVALIVTPAAPALAHTVGGVGATNFRTTLSSVAPAVPGVSLTVIENGSRLELRNDTGTEVVVAGYEGEPYARVGPTGVFLNDNSPATYLNADRFSGTPVPAGVDPAKPPTWRQVADEPLLRWHDHRIHWMLTTLPAAVAADPTAEHHLSTWTVELSYGGTRLVATGSLDWVPGPSPWPWFLLMALLVGGLVAATFLARPHRVLAAAVVAVLVAEVVHRVGVMLVIAGTVPERLGALFGSDAVLIWPFALLGAWLLWRGFTGAIWLAGPAGVLMATTLVIDDAPSWWRSSAPTALPLTLNRVVLALAVGAGVGLAAAVWPLIRRHGPPPRPWTPPPAASSPESPAGDLVPAGDAPPGDLAQAGVGRRRVAGYLAVGALGALTGAAAGSTLGSPKAATPAPAAGTPLGDVGARAIPFHGPRQAGIATPVRPQAHAWVGAFDLEPGADANRVRTLLRQWTDAAASLTKGEPFDDAVTLGLGPAALTITVAFGPSLFGQAGVPASARPAALAPLPAFGGERLDPARSDGDLGVIVAADDPVVVAHAARVLRRLGSGTVRTRWQMSGFNPARGAGPDSATPRNLMGQIDGTNNPKPADPNFAERVFVPPDAEEWLRGGSYVVIRRIRMLLDDWDKLPLAEQEKVIGRRKDTGAPLSGGDEFTPPNFGSRAIPESAHIRLAAPAFNEGAAILRRGFSYTEGDESGLLFIAWQADPRRGFIPVQRRLVAADALGQLIRHETSALFVAPAGIAPGEYVGQRLLEGR